MIGENAFENCVALKEIALPDSLHDIANSAFKNAGLKSVNLGDGVLASAGADVSDLCHSLSPFLFETYLKFIAYI